MKRTYSKTCVMCEDAIPPYWIVCPECFKLVQNHMHEQWFQDLVYMHKMQVFITRIEKDTLREDFIGEIENGIYTVKEFPDNFKRKKYRTYEGRPTIITQRLEERCKELRKQGLSYRKIAKIVNVSYVTVRTILLKN